MERKSYPSDEEWAFIAPYLMLMGEEGEFNGVRWIIRTGAQWRMMPNDLPSWYTVHQQSQRWVRAGGFEAMVRLAQGRHEPPSAVIFDSRTLDSIGNSGN